MDVKETKEIVGGEAIIFLSTIITGYCLMYLAEILSEKHIYNFRLAYPFKQYNFAKFFIENIKLAVIKIRLLNPIGPLDPYCRCANRFLAGIWKLGYLTMFLGYPVCLLMRLVILPIILPIRILSRKGRKDETTEENYSDKITK